MREIHLVHAEEDVGPILQLASEIGLIVRDDDPSFEPAPKILRQTQLNSRKAGVFVGYRPEWVFGDFEYQLIESGYYKGKYFQRPTTNYAGILFYFFGERRDADWLRLGSGFVSRDVEWYRPGDHTVHPAPSEISETFNRIRKKIDTKKYIVAGGRRYVILPKALEKLSNGSHRPPFDYMDSEFVQGLT